MEIINEPANQSLDGIEEKFMQTLLEISVDNGVSPSELLPRGKIKPSSFDQEMPIFRVFY